MKKFIYFFLFIILSLFSCINNESNFEEIKGQYFGQPLPGKIPQVFAPGLISTGFHEMNICFSPSGKEMFFFRCGPVYTPRAIFYSKMVDSIWSIPKELPFVNINRSDYYPFVSPNGDKLYFNSTRIKDSSEISENFYHGIWFAEKVNGMWENPQEINFGLDYEINGTNPSVALSGNIYFNAEIERNVSDIYVSKYKNGSYQEPEKLSDAVNSNTHDFHPYIAPDESYILFDSMRESESFGYQDIYISFRNDDGKWLKAINLGRIVNTENVELRPFVTFDQKYLFFISNKYTLKKLTKNQLSSEEFTNILQSPGNGSQDIYWVDASFIQELKKQVLAN